MPSLSQLCKNALRLTSVAALLTLPSLAAGLSATATYTSTLDPHIPGVYDYNVTLNNTGSTTVGTLWFAWVPGNDFLSPKPTNVGLPAGWTDNVFGNAAGTGYSIRWVAGAGSLLQAGQSLTGFSFDSTETPAQLLGTVASGTGAGDPILTSFVYSGTPFSDAGSQFVATAATPEPSSLLLLATGLLGGAGSVYRRLKIERSA